MEEYNNKNKYRDRSAQFYRLQYVVVAGVGLTVLLAIWFWSERQQAEDARRHLITMCYSDCIGMFNEDKSILESNLHDPSVQKECMDSCQKKYSR